MSMREGSLVELTGRSSPLVIPLPALLRGISAIWMTERPAVPPEQVSREDQRLIDEARMLKRVWPRPSRSEQKKIEHLAAHTVT